MAEKNDPIGEGGGKGWQFVWKAKVYY